MLNFLRAVAVMLGVIGAFAAATYFGLAVWDRTHPPALPQVSPAPAGGGKIGPTAVPRRQVAPTDR